MTKKGKKGHKHGEQKPVQPVAGLDTEDQDLEDEALPVRIGVYSQHELAFGDIMRTIFRSLDEAYKEGLSRKEVRKVSGIKKKTLRKIEGMDMSTSIGDILRVLATANKTLEVVPLDSATPEAAEEDAKAALEDVLSEVDSILEEINATQPGESGESIPEESAEEIGRAHV